MSSIPRRLSHFDRPLSLFCVLLFFGTVAGYLNDFSWLLALAAHFRVQFVLASLGLLVLALVSRRWPLAAAGAVLAAANAAPILPYFDSVEPLVAGSLSDIRVIAFNLHGTDTDLDAFRQFIIRSEPDVVLLTELPPDQSGLYAAIADRLPYRVTEQHSSVFDVALFSRMRPVRWRMDRSASRYLPVLTADLCDRPEADPAARCLRIVGLHAARPFGGGLALQRAQFDIAATMASEQPDYPTVLLGDLNVTPWASAFSRLLAQSGLRDSALGYGLQATWPFRWPPLGLPIDHVLVGPQIDVRDRRVGPDFGSDHLPAIADLAVRR